MQFALTFFAFVNFDVGVDGRITPPKNGPIYSVQVGKSLFFQTPAPDPGPGCE